MQNSSLLRSMIDPVLEAISENDLSEDQVEKLIDVLLKDGTSELRNALMQSAPSMLADETASRLGFEERNYLRWKKPLDLLMVLWRVCQEVGEDHAHSGPGEMDPLVFDTLAHLHPRALLIASEIMCLLRAGFADGALSRWRSLHEIIVVAMFIAQHGEIAALPYRLSVWFTAERRARNYNTHAERARLTPLSQEEFADIVRMRQNAQGQLGRALETDWDWAAEALGKKRPNFADLEKAVDLDHWRPRVQWACQHIHGGFVFPDRLLGQSEAKELLFQVGASNSGLSDPIQMTAISLMQMTLTFLQVPEIDMGGLVFMKIVQHISDDILEAATSVQEKVL